MPLFCMKEGIMYVCFSTLAAACSSRQFQCGDGSCVEMSSYCDFRPDCPDKSDEAHCGEFILYVFVLFTLIKTVVIIDLTNISNIYIIGLFLHSTNRNKTVTSEI